jgi:Cobalamin adenosyltransferase
MSIATKRGDGGQTGLVGDVRVSKADARVEAYGCVDELNSVLCAQHLSKRGDLFVDRSHSEDAVSTGSDPCHGISDREREEES